MKVSTRTIPQLAVLCIALSVFSFAASDASLYVVHGIPGRDIASDLNPGLPIDVLLNGEVCVIHALAFDSTSGPLSVPAGDYDVKISAANSLAPCTNAPLVEATGTLAGGSAVTIVAALDSSGAPALETFTDNLATVTAGQVRFTFAQTADAPAVQVALTQQDVKTPAKSTFTLNPGAGKSVELPYGSYSVEVSLSGTTLYSGTISAPNQSVELAYIVGEASNNSVTVITRLIRDVF